MRIGILRLYWTVLQEVFRRHLVASISCTVALAALLTGTPQQTKITIVVARTPSSWPMYLAKEAGYYTKQGLDVNLVFGVHPVPIAMLVSGEAQMASYTLDQTMQVASRDGSFTAIGSFSKKTMFALMAPKNISSVRDLKGQRIGVSQIGDGPYNYTLKLLAKSGLTPRDVEWVPLGNSRDIGLLTGRVDATLLNAPAYFRLEEAGFHSLANTADYDDVYGAVVNLYRKTTVAKNPQLPERLLKSHAEAVKRFYEDKPFAVKAFIAYDKQNPDDVARAYDYLMKSNAFERVPYVPAAAVRYIRDNQYDRGLSEQMNRFDFRSIIDNARVDRLVREGFFEALFGADIRKEQARGKSQAF